MGKLRQIGKKIGKGIKSVGKKLKSGLGKVAKAFGKLGPLGSIALSFMLPGIGSWISSVAQGSSFLAPIAQGLVNAGKFVKNGVGKVFNKVTDAIEYSINKVSSIGGEGVAGSNFRNWASEATNGFIEPSTQGVSDITVPGSTKTITGPDGFTKDIQVPETTISADAQVGIGGPKVPKTPKGMTDPVYVDGLDTDLKKGFYEQADLDTYYTGTSKTLDIGTGKITDAVTPVETGIATPGESYIKNNQTTIRTSDGMPKPKVEGKGYFGRAKDVYKKVAPIQAIGSEIQAGEDAEVFAKQQQQAANRAYFSSIGQDLLASGNSNPNVSVINFNNPNPSDSEIYNLVNSYGGILGTS
jgi:hypothetical protein